MSLIFHTRGKLEMAACVTNIDKGNDAKHPLSHGVAVVIRGGVEHNATNTSRSEPLRLYTPYSPPEHPAGAIHRIRPDETER